MPICIPKIKVRYQSINEILRIKEYWNLIVREPFLSITWEIDFSQACGFCRMSKDHKNFRFTPIPDKANDLIYFKSPKNIVFWSFLTSYFSRKSSPVTCNWIWTAKTILNLSKNKQANSEKAYGQMGGRTDYTADGQMEGQTLFHRTLLAMFTYPTWEITKDVSDQT